MAPDPERPSILPSTIVAYIAAHAAAPDPVLVGLRRRTAELGRRAMMQVSAEEGALLTLLTRLVGARRAVEVGTFTGYSSICIARGLAPGGTLLCCDVDEAYTAMARDAWDEAGLTDHIELRLAPALETLEALPADDVHAFDLAFIDADKEGYAGYYQELIVRLRPGGLLLVDNTLWSGRVVDPADEDATTGTMRRFNDMVAADDRVESFLLPVSDGLTIIRKR